MPLMFVLFAVLVVCCWAVVAEPGGAKTVDEGGRQNSSKASARREECIWMYVAEESRDIVLAVFEATRLADDGKLAM